MRLEHALLTQMGEELASWHVLQEHIELSGILGESLKADDEGMRESTEDAVLVGDVIDLL